MVNKNPLLPHRALGENMSVLTVFSTSALMSGLTSAQSGYAISDMFRVTVCGSVVA